VSSLVQDAERSWHDSSFVSRREHARNLRLARKRRGPGAEISAEREYEKRRDLKYDHLHPPPKGDPSRAVPQAFDESGVLRPELRKRLSPRQADQAHLLLEYGLGGKARRQAWCCIIARPLDCTANPEEHKFYKWCRCGLRYCPVCGPLCFRELFVKHSRLVVVVERLLQHRPAHHRPRVLAKLDITSKKLGRMPTRAEVREFNRDIRKLCRAIERHFGISRKDYGVLWVDEFGRMNSNLHAHAIYCGPWLPQKEVSRIWAEIRADGSFIISIKAAKSFEVALSHCLKYPSKFFDAPPFRLADLELAFHRVRRVHAVAEFYNPKIEREPGEDENEKGAECCPLCHALLGEPARGWTFVEHLQREGRRNLEEVRTNPAARMQEHTRRVEEALKKSGSGPP
jgi:hypothetical protein